MNRTDLHALADNELTPAEAALLRETLKSDPVAAAEFDAILNLKDCIREKVRPVPCDDTWKACLGRIKEVEKTRRTEAFVGKYSWALCAAFFGLIVVGGYFHRGGTTANVESADIARMITNLVPTSAPTPPRSNEALSRWLDSLLGQARQSVDPARLQILNVAEGQVDGRRVVRFALRDASGDLALLVIPSAVGFAGMEAVPTNGKYVSGHVGRVNCVAWNAGNASLVLFAERPHADLARVGDRISIN